MLWLLLFMTLVASCGECPAGRRVTQGSPEEPAKADAGQSAMAHDGLLTDFEIFPVDERIIIREGLEDFTNRYAFTVMVTASIPQGGTRRCSGAIIHPRLVLTAAHCVCRDTMNCAGSVTVTTVIYDSSQGVLENLIGGLYQDHDGEVHPHPGFKIVSDSKATGSIEADLAVIVLNRPIASTFRPVRLATDEPHFEESVTIVGYGQVETSDLTLGVRRFGKKKITGFTPEGGFLAPQELVALSSGGGAPCLLEHEGGTVLVGLISGYSGERPAFTGVYRYRDWLLSEFQQSTSSLNSKDPTP